MEKKDKTNKKGQENWSHKNDFPIEEVWHTYKALAELCLDCVPLRNTISMAFAQTSRV